MTIEVRQLHFAYKDRPILTNVTFEVESENLLCVLGPNGVGKSTLFRCMLGLSRDYEGEILIDGTSIKEMKPAQLAKHIAYIPQSHHPTFNFSVLSTVLMGLTVHMGSFANPKKEEENVARQALEALGISHLWNRGYAEISGGERQLALIARALVQQARILIMDEPTANLDYGNQMRVMAKVHELAKQGYIIILSTHNPEHALLYGNKALVLYKGTVYKFGRPKDIVTESLIHKVYGVRVKLQDILSGNELVRMIVPNRDIEERSHVYLDRREHPVV